MLKDWERKKIKMKDKQENTGGKNCTKEREKKGGKKKYKNKESVKEEKR